MERIYNIFLFFKDDVCSAISYKVHDHSGTDEEGIELLKARLSDDFREAVVIDLEKPFSLSEYNTRCRLGTAHHLYDEAFSECNNSIPLFISTPVKDGRVSFNYSSEHHAFDVNDAALAMGINSRMDDWLVKYSNEKEINLPQLIHDDYFLAIKLTFNAHLYVSAMKLLVSCIDSLSYVEYGYENGSFVKWLEAYADLKGLGITAVELWELRNGILHMTNLNAKKVHQKKVRRISFRVGGSSDYSRDGIDGTYYFDFHALIQSLADATGRWIETYNSDRDKFVKFVERYDETISDSRIATIKLTS